MARQPRLIIPGLPHYIHQYSHLKLKVFQEYEDYQCFMRLLSEAAQKFFVQLHAYALMPTYIQLLATPKDDVGLAKMMQWIGRFYVPYYNQKYKRTGTIWEGRFKTAIVEPVMQLACAQFIELTPVLNHLVQHEQEYPWTSYAHHIGIKSDGSLTPSQQYWSLGNTPFERELTYKKDIEALSSSKKLKEIAQILKKSGILGEVSFIQKLEQQLGKSLRPQKKGRPANKNT